MELELLISKTDSANELLSKCREMLMEYGEVVVTIRPNYQSRSPKQNSFYQLYVKRIAQQSGLSNQPNGEDYLRALLKDRAIQLGYPYMTDEDGNIKYKEIFYCDRYFKFMQGKSSKDATIAEFKFLLKACDEIAQEFGYVLEDTQD